MKNACQASSPGRWRRGLAIVLCVSLAACAGPRPGEFPPATRLGDVPPGAALEIFISASALPRQQAEIDNKVIGEDVQQGVKAGVFAGAYGSLACGPFFFYCAPFFSLLGMGFGAALGLGHGAVASMSSDQQARLEGRLRAEMASNPPKERLQLALRELAGRHYRLDAEEPGRVLMINLEQFGLQLYRNDEVILVMKATALLKRGKELEASRAYLYQSPPAHVDRWIEDHQAYVASTFKRGYGELAQNIIGDLRR